MDLDLDLDLVDLDLDMVMDLDLRMDLDLDLVDLDLVDLDPGDLMDRVDQPVARCTRNWGAWTNVQPWRGPGILPRDPRHGLN